MHWEYTELQLFLTHLHPSNWSQRQHTSRCKCGSHNSGQKGCTKRDIRDERRREDSTAGWIDLKWSTVFVFLDGLTQVAWVRAMSLDHVYVSHNNSLNIKVNFECTWEMATTSALIDSYVTKNFIDIQMVKWWGLPQKTLPRPQPIVNVDRTKNKVGMVTEACILKVLYNKCQHLQRFYVTDLGFDQVLLGYPWLSTFSPLIDWKVGRWTVR